MYDVGIDIGLTMMHGKTVYWHVMAVLVNLREA